MLKPEQRDLESCDSKFWVYICLTTYNQAPHCHKQVCKWTDLQSVIIMKMK